MTVAAVILAASPEAALADADGMPAVRRIADVAWSGGAVPIVVVARDPTGAIAAALSGAAVTLAEPAPGADGAAAQLGRGVEVATREIHETDGALLWPAAFTWVGPETVTSLIEAFGSRRAGVLRPVFDGVPGWPVLVAAEQIPGLASATADRQPGDLVHDLDAAGANVLSLELGDPGTIHDRATPRSALPPYTGPTDPPAGHVHEWGAGVADQPDDVPLRGPSLAPYSQAVAEDPDQPG